MKKLILLILALLLFSSTVSAIEYSDYEKDLMYRIVYAEAGICSDLTQQIVAQVILNRVDSPEFPDSIEGVIFQPGQFSPAPDLWRYPIDERVVANVDLVLESLTPCPRNILFFKSSWCTVWWPYDHWTTLDGVDFYAYGGAEWLNQF